MGHSISKNGIKPNGNQIKAIVDALAPTNIKELQSYIELINYYGKLIPNLSSELSCLYQLLNKDKKFIWTESEQRVFDRSKKLSTNKSILELYDPEKEIIVACDASPYCVGSHIVNGIEKPVMFASSTLSKSQQNYS